MTSLVGKENLMATKGTVQSLQEALKEYKSPSSVGDDEVAQLRHMIKAEVCEGGVQIQTMRASLSSAMSQLKAAYEKSQLTEDADELRVILGELQELDAAGIGQLQEPVSPVASEPRESWADGIRRRAREARDQRDARRVKKPAPAVETTAPSSEPEPDSSPVALPAAKRPFIEHFVRPPRTTTREE